MKSLETYLLQHYSPHTVKCYLKQITAYLAYNSKAQTASHQQVLEYIKHLRTRYLKASTLNSRLASVKAYYRYLNYIQKRKDNPAQLIILRDQRSNDIQLQDLLSQQELEKLLEKPFFKAELQTRNKVLLSLLVYQGLQARELEGLELQDVNLVKGTIYIRSSRTSNSRTLSLQASQILLLNDYIHEARPKLLKGKTSPYLLLDQDGDRGLAKSYTSYVKRRFKQYPKRVTITTIRQSVLANLLKSGHDLRVVQVFAGHKYPSTTEKYKQSQVEKLQQAIARYHPLG